MSFIRPNRLSNQNRTPVSNSLECKRTHSAQLPSLTQAKLAEEAERYEDMVQNVKALAELNVQLNVEVSEQFLKGPLLFEE